LTTETPNPTQGGDTEGASTLDVLDRIEQKLNGAESGSDDEGQTETEGQSAEVKPEDDATEESQPQITTTDLAKFLGVDEDLLDLDEDGTVKFKTKVDGQDGAAKLADFLKTYQIQGHAENRVKEVVRQEEALRAKTQEVEAKFAQRLQYAERLNNIAGQQLLHEFQSIDWRALEAQDPGTAALWRQKFQERHGQLQQVDVAIRQEKAQAEQKTQAEKAERERKEAEKLPLLIPEWKDASVAHKEKAEITAWAQKAGLQPEEMEVLTSTARNVQLLRKAMLSDRLALQKVETEKRVRTAPTLVKPGTTADDGKAKTLKDLKDTVRKTGGKKGSIEAYLIAKGIA
jgi:hypothetical protein